MEEAKNLDEYLLVGNEGRSRKCTYLGLVKCKPSLDLISITLEYNRGIVIEVLDNTGVQKASILRDDVEWDIPIPDVSNVRQVTYTVNAPTSETRSR